MDLSYLEKSRISKGLPIPLYFQIAECLREAIKDLKENNNQKEDIPLPTENELSEYYDVHRGTVRHALDLLEGEGLIYRERGKGTFLHRRRVEQDLSFLLSTTEDLEGREWTTKTKILEISEIQPGSFIKRKLQLDNSSQVWNIKRLRIANDEPIGLQEAYIPVDLTPNLEKYDLTLSLTRTIQQVYGIIFQQADQIISARKANKDEAKLLGIINKDPLIVVRGITWDQYERPIEYLDSIWRYDRYDLRIRHKRE